MKNIMYTTYGWLFGLVMAIIALTEIANHHSAQRPHNTTS